MKTFFCKTCNQKFEAEGTKEEWIDPTYGPCLKFIAFCPNDGSKCEEHRPSKANKDKSTNSGFPSCGMGCSCCH